MVMSSDPERICRPSGEWLMQLILSVCPTHDNGGAGHDDNLPLTTSMALVNFVLKAFDKFECKGKKG
jgi:hypothetical protein